MLLNLSNHLSPTWPENQTQEANKLFGSIQDMPFPPIDPYSNEDQVYDLANKYLNEILLLKPQAVHLMGELTFTFQLVSLLKSHGITCLASTTSRNTQEMPDGTKISKFQFVRFRSY